MTERHSEKSAARHESGELCELGIARRSNATDDRDRVHTRGRGGVLVEGNDAGRRVALDVLGSLAPARRGLVTA